MLWCVEVLDLVGVFPSRKVGSGMVERVLKREGEGGGRGCEELGCWVPLCKQVFVRAGSTCWGYLLNGKEKRGGGGLQGVEEPDASLERDICMS